MSEKMPPMKWIVISVVLIALALAGYLSTSAPQESNERGLVTTKQEIQKTVKNILNPIIVLDTQEGEIAIELFPQSAPKNVKYLLSQIETVNKGKVIGNLKNNYTLFEFPENAQVELPLEINPFYNHGDEGVVAMFNDPHSPALGNMLYITHDSQVARNGKYSVVGQVKKGMDAVKSMQKGAKISDIILLK